MFFVLYFFVGTYLKFDFFNRFIFTKREVEVYKSLDIWSYFIEFICMDLVFMKFRIFFY